MTVLLLGEGLAVMVLYIRIAYIDHVHLPLLQLPPPSELLVILLMHKSPHATGNTPNLSLYLAYFAYYVLSSFHAFPASEYYILVYDPKALVAPQWSECLREETN